MVNFWTNMCKKIGDSGKSGLLMSNDIKKILTIISHN